MIEKPAIAVVGLGAMGLGIAQVFAQAGFPVLATDAQVQTRDSAAARLAAALEPRVAAGKMSAADRDACLSRLTVVAGLEGLSPAAMVIEAIIERFDAKAQLFNQLEQIVGDGTVLATNTSSLSVADLARALKVPGRCIGLHFFNPAPAMKLVELVAHPGADEASLTRARALTEQAGKTVIACADRPGFIVNRCARPFYGEAFALMEEGRSASDIDAAMLAAGYRIGPLSLVDLIGADINLAALETINSAMDNHPRYHVFEILKRQVAAGRLGRKSGAGFIVPHSVGAAPVDAPALALRIEATLANEAASLLGEGGVAAADIDTAVKLGLNFPRGPFEMIRAHGVARILETLRDLDSKAPPHLKGRYAPVPALERLQ